MYNKKEAFKEKKHPKKARKLTKKSKNKAQKGDLNQI
jgi:hypothetical protein